MFSQLAILAFLAVQASAAVCNLRFVSITTTETPSIFGAQSVQVQISPTDGSKPGGFFAGGCYFGYFFSGCTWTSGGKSTLDNYTVEHSPLSAFGIAGGPLPVNITGNDCEGTTLGCTDQGPDIKPIINPDGSVSGFLYTYYTYCNADGGAASDGAVLSPPEIVAGSLPAYGCSTCPSTITTASTTVAYTPPPALTCLNQADPDECIPDYVSCGDGVLSAGYPGTITDYSNPDTVVPTESPNTNVTPQPTSGCVTNEKRWQTATATA